MQFWIKKNISQITMLPLVGNHRTYALSKPWSREKFLFFTKPFVVNNWIVKVTLGSLLFLSLIFLLQSGLGFSHGSLFTFHAFHPFKCFCMGYWWYLIKMFLGSPDSLSLVFKFLTLATMPVCLILAPYTIKNYVLYSIYLCTIFGFLLWCFHTTNLLSFFVAFEALAIPVFLMLGIWGSVNTRPRRLWASWLFLFFTLVTAGFMFISIMYLDASLNSLDFSVLFNATLTKTEKLIIGAAFFLSFAAKLPVVPFHIWLPEAHVEAPTIGSIILASLLLKLGSYGFVRFFINFLDYFLVFFSRSLSYYILFSVIYTCLVALRQTDMKKIIAYSSVSHMNLILLGFMSGTLHGYQGFIYVSVGHGFVAGGLFFLLHVLYDRYHTRELHYFSGLGQVMPLFSTMLFFFCIANFAFPGTVNFIGETLVLQGIINKYPSLLPYVLVGLVLTTGFTISFYTQLVYGTLSVRLSNIFPDLTRLEFLILVYLAGFILIGGLHAPAVFFNMPEIFCVL